MRSMTEGVHHHPTATLKVGIHFDMLASGKLTAEQISQTAQDFVGQPRYLRALTSGAFRIDLDGKRVLPVRVPCEEEAHALARLAKLDARRALKAAKVVKPVETKDDNISLASNPAPAESVNPLTGRVVLGLRRS